MDSSQATESQQKNGHLAPPERPRRLNDIVAEHGMRQERSAQSAPPPPTTSLSPSERLRRGGQSEVASGSSSTNRSPSERLRLDDQSAVAATAPSPAPVEPVPVVQDQSGVTPPPPAPSDRPIATIPIPDKVVEDLERRAASQAKSLQTLHSRLDETRDKSRKGFHRVFSDYVRQKRQRIWHSIEVGQLKEFTDARNIRLDAFSRAGINNAAALPEDPGRLAQVDGVGPTTAVAVSKALEQARTWADSQPVGFPRPDDIGQSEADLLHAAALLVRSSRISPELLAELKAFADELQGQRRQLKRDQSVLRRWFRPDRNSESIQQSAELLMASSSSPRIAEVQRQATKLSNLDQPPRDFAALLDDYRSNYADYSAALEEIVAELGGAGLVPVERAQRGLPSSVAARVEALALDTAGLNVVLRGYQRFGTQFMVVQNRTIVGDEMGLGKTIQALAAATHLANREGAVRFMVVAPASILANWEREIELRTQLPHVRLHGPNRDQLMGQWLQSGGVAITSYATLRSLRYLDQVAVDFLIADEAHYAKNPESRRTQALAQLARNANRLVLMTGTPMENKLDEFVSLLNLANPSAALLASDSGADRASAFRKAAAPYYLRRNQEDVLTELPDLVEIEDWVELGSAERQAYNQEVARRNLMGMRQAATFGAGVNSAKMQRLGELLNSFAEDGQKVLVFSYFLDALTVASSVVDPATPTFRIDGSISPEARTDTIDRFGAQPGHAVLCSQISSGGVGLNIQAASVVVLLEPQFKPTVEWQAVARAYRMGQSRKVTVHRLLAVDCFDESLFELLGDKTKLFDNYARPSSLKEATGASTDRAEAELADSVLLREVRRLDAA